MNEKKKVKTSKFLSLVLRHEPEAIGLELDAAGWVEVKVLLEALRKHGRGVTWDELREVVETNEKQRFALSEDGARIRANQGHSVEVELGYTPQEPPEFLYHGTATRFLGSIMAGGLERGERHHVHLSTQTHTAHQVGTRHGKPVLLTIKARAMHEAGHPFFLTANGVWLAEAVPAEFILPSVVSVERATEMAPVRSGRASRAAETVAIGEAGWYVAPGGQVVKIAADIQAGVAGTRLYRLEESPAPTEPGALAMQVEVTEETTLSALRRLAGSAGGLVAGLNFASAKNPGGGFLGGAEAQEESLARSSSLYPCLLAAHEYYDQNRAHRSTLYLDLAIWSPSVVFFRDDEGTLLGEPFTVAMITAPAPNAGAVAANEPERAPLIEPTLRRRAEFVLSIALEQGVRRLVLGAWGCGVFRNDPRMVAKVFADLLSGPFAGQFEKVTFAIYDRTKERGVVRAFQEAIGQSKG